MNAVPEGQCKMKNGTAVSKLRSERNSSNFQTFVREDWTLLRSLETICQKAGVPVEKLYQIVVKELADNALGASGSCEIDALKNGDTSLTLTSMASLPRLPNCSRSAALFHPRNSCACLHAARSETV